MLSIRNHVYPTVLNAIFGATLVAAVPRGHDGGIDNDNDNGNDANDDGADTSPVSAPGASTGNGAGTAVTNSTVGAGLNGDSACPGSRLMCVTAFVNGTTVTYELQSSGTQSLGWMAIGFGNQMPNTPMVIMWPNSDGSITLSQRQATGYIMPTVVANPPKVATVAPTLSSLSGSQPKLVFTIDGTATQVPLIWAFGTDRPGAAKDSSLAQHLDSGTFSLDLTKVLPANASSGVVSTGGGTIPFQTYQKTIIAHASLSALGFLILLPAGVLLARWTRTYNRRWFTGHWIIQSGLAGVCCIVGIILGFVAVHQHGIDVPSTHKTIGKVLLSLYLVQCALGTIIHFFKMRFRFGRPPQNYLHAILGLAIIALSFCQVRLGYRQEWPNATGRGKAPNGVNIAWTVWLVILALAYAIGLGFLPRQYRQESLARNGTKNLSAGRLSNFDADIQEGPNRMGQLQSVRDRDS